jgi:hypothetical protein
MQSRAACRRMPLRRRLALGESTTSVVFTGAALAGGRVEIWCVKATGFAQKLGQLAAVNRDFQ